MNKAIKYPIFHKIIRHITKPNGTNVDIKNDNIELPIYSTLKQYLLTSDQFKRARLSWTRLRLRLELSARLRRA